VRVGGGGIIHASFFAAEFSIFYVMCNILYPHELSIFYVMCDILHSHKFSIMNWPFSDQPFVLGCDFLQHDIFIIEITCSVYYFVQKKLGVLEMQG
jgi:hypothetical protein